MGEPKERLVLRVQVEAVRFIESHYGVTTLYTMADEAGRVCQWFASRQVLGEQPTGEWVTIKATVKRHDVVRGHKVSVLTRCQAQ